jgi:hypothetical protein
VTRARAALLVFPAAAVLLCADALRPGRVLLPTALDSLPPWRDEAAGPPARSNPLAADSLLLTLPARAYNHQMLRQGRLPFWNPYAFCGYPHLALIQNGALYPLTLPLDLLDPFDSIDYGACLHLALAGLLMYAFLRRGGLARGPAVVGGLAFELSGFFLVRLSVPSYLHSGTWLPAMLLGARAVVSGEPGRGRWALPAAVALSILGGHPQVTMLALLLTAAYAVGSAPAGAPAPARGRALLHLAGLVLLGSCLAGAALVPFAELLAHSARETVPLDVYRRSATPAVALAQALVPDLFGHPVDGTYWFGQRAALLDGVAAEARYWGFNAIGQNVFTGVAPLALAVLALVRARGRRDVVLFGLAAAASLAVFLRTPLLDLAWAALPGFRYSRPDRVLFVYMAALSVLAAHGAEAIGAARGGEPARTRPARLLARSAAALLAWGVVAPHARPSGLAELAAWTRAAWATWAAEPVVIVAELAFAAAVIAAVAAIARRGKTDAPASAALVVLVAAPAVVFGWRFNPAQPEPALGRTAAEHALRERSGPTRLARVLAREELFLPPNLTTLLELEDTQGASAAGLESYLGLVEAVDPSAVVGGKYLLAFRDARAAASPLLRLLSVEWMVADAAGGAALSRRADFLPRFYVVPRAEAYADVAQARARLLSPDFDPRAAALVPAEDAAKVVPASAAGASGRARGSDAVTIVRYEPHRIELEVDAAAGGLLVSSDTAYPGWESAVDGRSAPTLLVNTAFRGVALSPGRHRVTMEYVPRSFRAGLALSGAAVVVMLVALARRG